MPRMETLAQFRLPAMTHKLAIYGRTGDGKTVQAAWVLSQAPFDYIPYIIVDFKRDDLLNSTERIKRISLNDPIPKQPGLYIVHPMPHQHAAVENFLWRVYQKRRTGLFIDEGFMLPNPSPAWDAILTQGRSLRIPVINLTQRPVWLSRFVTSQADFHSLFPFNDDRDNETVLKFMPRDIREHIAASGEQGLAQYHSYWFDVEKKSWCVVGPAPHPDDITQILEDRLKPKHHTL